MNARAIERRLGAREQVLKAPLRRRCVWREPGDPEPQAEPGEQLTIISWMWPDEEPAEPPPGARPETP